MTAGRPTCEPLRCHTLAHTGGTLRVALEGDLNEEADLEALLDCEETLILDLGGVRRINSTGVHKLILFLVGLRDEQCVVAERCSPAVVAQLNLVPMIVQRVRVRSVIAPLECTNCLVGCEVVVDVEPGHAPDLPPIPCYQCGASMELADLPERYFGFLET